MFSIPVPVFPAVQLGQVFDDCSTVNSVVIIHVPVFSACASPGEGYGNGDSDILRLARWGTDDSSLFLWMYYGYQHKTQSCSNEFMHELVLVYGELV
jgi:hypothetical protein